MSLYDGRGPGAERMTMNIIVGAIIVAVVLLVRWIRGD